MGNIYEGLDWRPKNPAAKPPGRTPAQMREEEEGQMNVEQRPTGFAAVVIKAVADASGVPFDPSIEVPDQPKSRLTGTAASDNPVM